MCFLTHFFLPLRQADENVTRLFIDTESPSHCAGAKTLEGRTFSDLQVFHEQGIDIDFSFLICVCDSRLQKTFEIVRNSFTARKLQDGQSLVDAFSPNKISDKHRFSRSNADIFQASSDFHDLPHQAFGAAGLAGAAAGAAAAGFAAPPAAAGAAGAAGAAPSAFLSAGV
jgi:hypothetical protein